MNRTAHKTFILRYYLLIAALLMWGIIPISLSADNGDVPFDLQAKLILTALTYDKNLQEKPDKHLKIGVLYFPPTPQSQEEGMEFLKTLNGFKDKKISGLNFDTAIFTYTDISMLKKDITDNTIDLLYLARGDTKTITDVIGLTRSEKILSCTSRAEYVTTCGVTMAVGLKDNKPKIYLNRSSAQLEGAEFSAKFLRIAELVGENTTLNPNR